MPVKKILVIRYLPENVVNKRFDIKGHVEYINDVFYFYDCVYNIQTLHREWYLIGVLER